MFDQNVHLEELTNLKRRACSLEKPTFLKGKTRSQVLTLLATAWVRSTTSAVCPTRMIHVAMSNQKAHLEETTKPKGREDSLKKRTLLWAETEPSTDLAGDGLRGIHDERRLANEDDPRNHEVEAVGPLLPVVAEAEGADLERHLQDVDPPKHVLDVLQNWGLGN